ncbi:8215_t:CDS:2 [Cetraspora pellucida]|uniref:8215_t:CDS:1 n=1 Tax=Cetraspora pellucida TaxID=1433469 RepID=A0A9N8YVC3_9GLOM|nr:8215_t:CDS:2 [Cetraspora pellucida]
MTLFQLVYFQKKNGFTLHYFVDLTEDCNFKLIDDIMFIVIEEAHFYQKQNNQLKILVFDLIKM